jgi:hypothetical protein
LNILSQTNPHKIHLGGGQVTEEATLLVHLDLSTYQVTDSLEILVNMHEKLEMHCPAKAWTNAHPHPIHLFLTQSSPTAFLCETNTLSQRNDYARRKFLHQCARNIFWTCVADFAS